MNTTPDVIVIGGSAAGLSAALILGRALRSVVVLDNHNPRNRFASHMHGVLGNDGVPPDEFLNTAREQLNQYDIEFRTGTAQLVRDNGTSVTVTTTDGDELIARRVLAATGARDVLPPIPGLAQGWGRDVLHCPYCHGWEVRNTKIAVLATSPMSLHHAKLLRQWTPDLVFFSAKAGPLDAATQSALAGRGVRVEPRQVTDVTRDDDGTLTGVTVAGGEDFNVEAIFAAADLQPIDDYLSPLVLDRTQIEPIGSFITVDAGGRTSNPRVWAAGNLVNPMATVPVAMASGAMAGGMINMDLVEDDFAQAGQ